MNETGNKCTKCGRRNYHRVYGPSKGQFIDCPECGSHVVDPKSVSGETVRLIIDTPIIDENIDGTPHLITSRRKHKDLLKKHNLVCKHYM